MSNINRRRQIFKGLSLASRAFAHAQGFCKCGSRFCPHCNTPTTLNTIRQLFVIGWTYDEIEAYIYYRSNPGPRRQLLLYTLGIVALEISAKHATIRPA